MPRLRPTGLLAIYCAAILSIQDAFAQWRDPCDSFDLRVCDPAAECASDHPGHADCRCPQGYIDLSPNFDRPGRKCLQVRPIANTGDCSVSDPLSCDSRKSEVCQFIDGRYQCACPDGYSKLPDGRCLRIDECQQARLHDCAPNARCVDKDVGFECECFPGLVDVSPDPRRPGRKCAGRVDECAAAGRHGVDCHRMAVCVDTADAFTCHCRPGFADISAQYGRPPGRECVEAVDECATDAANDCSANAVCEDAKDGYLCTCKPGFVDVSANATHFPGRVCIQPTVLSRPAAAPAAPDRCTVGGNDTCRANEACARLPSGQLGCDCAPNAFRFRDGTCRLQSACAAPHTCHADAVCTSLFDAYQCRCRPGFRDASADPSRPGRKCVKLVNECATNEHTCHPFAQCTDEADGYSCSCGAGYVDTSAKYGLAPGRHCAVYNDECADARTHTCDPHADCVDTADGYTCQCFAGFADLSSLAGRQPGRICTVQTACPRQKTDLIFLVDGSGSIGVQVFGNEVLRFLRDFVDLFEVGANGTRVGMIQYSDQLRHEFDLNAHANKTALKAAISGVQYLSGLTRTGAAIKHMINEGFTERRGMRPAAPDVLRVGIVITDGRSQDEVARAAADARRSHVTMFAIGVTDHVLAAELEAIAGAADRWFFVERFRGLDARLRSLVQRLACPATAAAAATPPACEPRAQTGCDRTLNEVCVAAAAAGGRPRCACPPGFERHPATRACGSPHCNPHLPTSCPRAERCARTPFGTYRCVCAEQHRRDQRTGVCLKNGVPEPDFAEKECRPGLERNPRTGRCQARGSCDPSEDEPCDRRLNQQCLLHPNGQFYTCRCTGAQRRHNVTGVCLEDECALGRHDCDPNARCTDTAEGFLCACPRDSIDRSPDLVRRPGRVCQRLRDECALREHDCPPTADCIDTAEGFACRCRAGLVDLSAEAARPGRRCRRPLNECATPSLHDCHRDADCIDTVEGFVCQCRVGFNDANEFVRPGRLCLPAESSHCKNGSATHCSANAICVDEPHGHRCECLPGFVDRSAAGQSGQRCDAPQPHPCARPDLNDCHAAASCVRLNASARAFSCRCNEGFVDVSAAETPGRRCERERSVCEDQSRNDCHQHAICTVLKPDELQANNRSYACKCRDGFVDRPSSTDLPGRDCVEALNECLDRTLHDCDPAALCEDLPVGFRCRCPPNWADQSTDAQRPGRLCREKVNECLNPLLHSCSRFADCLDKDVGYECRCRDGYHDQNPAQPGTVCKFVINECESPNLNDCHKEAECTDTEGGFECQCRAPFADRSAHGLTGRVCALDECADPRTHNCHENARCVDLAEGFTCVCADGFFDSSPNAHEPGRICLEFSNEESTVPPIVRQPSLDQVACGLASFCSLSRREVCVGGRRCECRPGESRPDADAPCEKVVRAHFALRLVRLVDEVLRFSSRYGSKESDGYRELEALFERDLLKAVADASVVSADVALFTHPKTVNSTWNDGVLVNFTLALRPNRTDACALWAQLTESLLRDRRRLASGAIEVAPDLDQLSPCHVEGKCGDAVCNKHLGHVCIGGKCRLDYCIDVDYCPANSSCVNLDFSGACECDAGFVDVRSSKGAIGLQADATCLRLEDVDECALQLHNCSAVAACRNLRRGYTCECGEGYVDGNRKLPGRQCAALLCDFCGGRGDCIPEADGGMRCHCNAGFSGPRCEARSTPVGFVAALILSVLFATATLCWLAYLCLRSGFVRRKVSWVTYANYNDNGSDLYTMSIPRPVLSLYPDDVASLKTASSPFAGSDEAERRVVSDFTRTTTMDSDGAINEVVSHYAQIDYPRGAEFEADTRTLGRPSIFSTLNGANTLSSEDDRSLSSYQTEGVYDLRAHENHRRSGSRLAQRTKTIMEGSED